MFIISMEMHEWVETKIIKKTRKAYLFSLEEDKDTKGFHKQIKNSYKVGGTCLLFVPKKT